MIVDPNTILDQHLFDYNLKNVQPNSYDLRLHRVFEIRGGINLYADGRKELPNYLEIEPTDKVHGYPNPSPPEPWFILKTNTLYQLEFKETVNLSKDYAAISIMRSSMSKSGASGEVGLYDSGYIGNCGMTISLKHSSNIQRGASVAQLLFFKADASRLYDGEYQDSKWAERLLNKK